MTNHPSGPNSSPIPSPSPLAVITLPNAPWFALLLESIEASLLIFFAIYFYTNDAQRYNREGKDQQAGTGNEIDRAMYDVCMLERKSAHAKDYTYPAGNTTVPYP